MNAAIHKNLLFFFFSFLFMKHLNVAGSEVNLRHIPAFEDTTLLTPSKYIQLLGERVDLMAIIIKTNTSRENGAGIFCFYRPMWVPGQNIKAECIIKTFSANAAVRKSEHTSSVQERRDKFSCFSKVGLIVIAFSVLHLKIRVFLATWC